MNHYQLTYDLNKGWDLKFGTLSTDISVFLESYVYSMMLANIWSSKLIFIAMHLTNAYRVGFMLGLVRHSLLIEPYGNENPLPVDYIT